MKIEKTFCDLCGAKITDEHPTRLILQKYEKAEGIYGQSKYNTTEKLDICEDCERKLADTIKKQKGLNNDVE